MTAVTPSGVVTFLFRPAIAKYAHDQIEEARTELSTAPK